MSETDLEYRCAFCNAAYSTRKTAMRCCSELFDRRDRLCPDGGTEVVGEVDHRAPTNDLQEVLDLETPTWDRVQRATREDDYSSPEAFIREAIMRLVGDVLDEDGHIECPHDDCDRTFATRRELIGHLGSSEHALDVPDGSFWCGYCGRGPLNWRGVNAHHGSTDHDGDPVRLAFEPDREDLIAPEEIPDHRNPELLEELYERHGGNYSEMCRQHDFDVSPGRVRHYLIEFGIHNPTPQGSGGELGVEYDRVELEQIYERNCGNISAMHRSLDEDVPYRTLHKTLKRLGIHNPTGSAPPQTPDRSTTDDQPDHDQADETDGSSRTDTDAGSQSSSDVDFADLPLPDWLDEASFYVAVDDSSGIVSLMDTLGWREPGTLESVLDELDLWDELEAGADGGKSP